MVEVSIKYTGDLHCDATHGPSQSKIATDAPTDNKGKGEAFSPTDLLATALGTCMLTTMAIRNEAINIENAQCSITKIMAANPRRVSEIQIAFKFPRTYSEQEQKALENAALTCPVIESLHPDMVKTVDFGWR